MIRARYVVAVTAVKKQAKKSPARGRANGGSAHIGKGPVHHAPERNLTTGFYKRNILIIRTV
jgi:hypothetical protein